MQRITTNPDQCGGEPCIRGLRIRVEDILELLAAGTSEAEILEDYPLSLETSKHAFSLNFFQRMRPEDFSFRLEAASLLATQVAATIVRDKLAFEFRYCVLLNTSCDDLLQSDEVVFPDDDGLIHEDLNSDEAVRLLCRDFRVPQWIDICVAYSARKHSHLVLECCGRFHSNDDRLYYFERGTQPFGIKSPQLPKDCKEGRKFWLPKQADFYSRMRRVSERPRST